MPDVTVSDVTVSDVTVPDVTVSFATVSAATFSDDSDSLGTSVKNQPSGGSGREKA